MRYGLTPNNDEERYIYFFDTPALELHAAKIIVRARRAVGDVHDSTVKFRPVDPASVSEDWRKYRDFKIEADDSEKGLVKSASFSRPVEKGLNEGPLRWVARDSSKPGRRGPETWLLHASAEWSEEHLEADPSAVAVELLRAFSQLGGASSAAWTAHRWRYADTAPTMNRECVWHAGDGLGLCGDWLNGGKVEGAWLSGRQLASQVMQSFQ
jgi:hypothetical protein